MTRDRGRLGACLAVGVIAIGCGGSSLAQPSPSACEEGGTCDDGAAGDEGGARSEEADCEEGGGVCDEAAACGAGEPCEGERSADDQPCDDESQGCNPAPDSVECKAECTYRCTCRRGIFATEYKNLFQIIVNSTFAGQISLEYERAVHDRVSVFGAFYAVAFESIGNDALVGFGGLFGARVNFLGRAPEGLWFAWRVGGFRRNARGNRDIQLRGVQTGGMLGWTGVFGRFVLSLGAGFSFAYGVVEVRGQSVKDTEWNPSLRIGIGVAF